MAACLRSGIFWKIFCFRRRNCKMFSHVSWNAFKDMPLERCLVERLNHMEIKNLTEIQQKSLGSVLKGDNVVINAETGSGKTLCYLVPVVDRLLKLETKLPGPSAVVLVPNMDLGYQVRNLFNLLCDPGLLAHPLHGNSLVRINNKYPIIVSTPQTLMQYNIKSLPSIQTIIIDEADLIISNGGKHFWKLLQSFEDQVSVAKYANLSDSKSSRQFIFVAATLPRRGEKSVFRKILNKFPGICHITSERVHKFVSSLRSVDVFVKEEQKLPQLLKCLNFLNDNLPSENFGSFQHTGRNSKFDGLLNDEEISAEFVEHSYSEILLDKQGQTKDIKVLVFANTVAMAKNVFEFLNSEERSTFEMLGKTSCSKAPLQNSVIQHQFFGDYINTKLPSNERFITKTGLTCSWRNKVGILHKEMSRNERQEVLTKFHENEIAVLVSTDLASRGLDFCDISHVVQLDYARNAADTLHRAGRTARAGNRGTVINFITDVDRELWKATKLTEKGTGTESFQEIFSRNRQFSRRIKKRTRLINR